MKNLKLEYDYISKYFRYDEASPSGLIWVVDRFGGMHHKIKIVAAGDVAGFISGNRQKKKWQVSLDGKAFHVHRVIMCLHMETNLDSNLFIDHINGNPLDNTIENLRLVDCKTNNRNTKVRVSSPSGFIGISRYLKDGNQVGWTATWTLYFDKYNSKQFSKSFNFRNFATEEDCLQAAKDFRKSKIDELNTMGYGYTDNHGR